MNEQILNKVIELKEQLLKEGFIIEGIFGSYIKGDFNQNSDIDILYNLDRTFKDKYKGYKAIAQIDIIQKTISSKLNIQADLIQKNSLGKVSAKYILPEVFYV